VLDPANETRAHSLRVPGQLDEFHPLRKLAEHHLQLQPGKVRPETEVLADAE
jgi:hypothetical protein